MHVIDEKHPYANSFIDLAAERLGGETLNCSDDFFAEMENMLKPGRGEFIDDKFTERGKWMDGWESRRSYGRDNGREFDWCVIRLGVPGVIRGVDVDTNHFRGNAPQSVLIEACHSKTQPDAQTHWTTILDRHDVEAHSQNFFDIQSTQAWTHVRLNIFPDGGVARFRVFGEAVIDKSKFLDGELIDLAYIKNGGKSVLCSDMFYSDKNNLIMPGRGINMGDGWETKRRRDPGPDWNIIQLGHAGFIRKVILDTHHFKGNYPDHFTLEGTNLHGSNDLASAKWHSLISKQVLYPHREHEFTAEVEKTDAAVTHIRLNIFPDGGVSRLRAFGYLSE